MLLDNNVALLFINTFWETNICGLSLVLNAVCIHNGKLENILKSIKKEEKGLPESKTAVSKILVISCQSVFSANRVRILLASPSMAYTIPGLSFFLFLFFSLISTPSIFFISLYS